MIRWWIPRWLIAKPQPQRYFSAAIEQHLRELGLSPYPAEEQQRDGR